MDLLYLPYLDDTDVTEDSQMIVHCGLSKTFPVNPKFKLTYLNAKGSAEMSRMILAFAGIPFIDNRLSIIEWEVKKLDPKYGILPMLEFEDQVVCHGASIARFLAKKYGIYGKDPLEQALADSVVDIIKDFSYSLKPYVESLMKIHIDSPRLQYLAKESLLKFGIPVVEKYLPILEEKSTNGNLHGFLLQSGISFADFAIASFYETLQLILPKSLLNYNNLGVVKEQVFAHPKLQQYLKIRKRTVL
ncbi:hypothetical protein FO519_007859 [Halicephalobus sp. NKZ332]|nr:hypothetical protein FO519_007859 [Halicephalobus sp. NKZ332]